MNEQPVLSQSPVPQSHLTTHQSPNVVTLLSSSISALTPVSSWSPWLWHRTSRIKRGVAWTHGRCAWCFFRENVSVIRRLCKRDRHRGLVRLSALHDSTCQSWTRLHCVSVCMLWARWTGRGWWEKPFTHLITSTLRDMRSHSSWNLAVTWRCVGVWGVFTLFIKQSVDIQWKNSMWWYNFSPHSSACFSVGFRLWAMCECSSWQHLLHPVSLSRWSSWADARSVLQPHHRTPLRRGHQRESLPKPGTQPTPWYTHTHTNTPFAELTFYLYSIYNPVSQLWWPN